ncbi:DUF1697 domain-containing protein [Pseudarthrobacter sp. NPDC092439]|uniref:DUF1697 domain-containing protein n=1 Tax=unclassified Pseudarthrobacter TaxID=2647000 RepID=UPI003811BACC
MGSYAVFLRGINVGGINIKMADLRQALQGCGFADAKTVLATGNAVLTSRLGARRVKQECEKCLRSAFGYEAWVVVLDAERTAELVAACPYPADDKGTHTYVTLSSDPAVLDQLETAGSAFDGAGLQRLGPEALAWLAPAGGTLDSPFSKLSAKAKYKAATTTRNLRTLIKVRDAAAALTSPPSVQR